MIDISDKTLFSIKSLYGLTMTLLHISFYLSRNLHNESYVAVYEKGNVTMQGVDGSTNVFVKEGDADIQVLWF